MSLGDEGGVADLRRVIVGAARLAILRPDVAGVQEAPVHGVDVAFQRLHVTAVADGLVNPAVRRHIAGKLRQRRWYFAPAHVRPNDVVALDARVSPRFDLGLEVALGRL